MNLRESVKRLLKRIGPGHITGSAYDTAWVARLFELDKPLGQRALDWICSHQLPDGSWGAAAPRYYHDRIICTLAAMTMLTRYGRRAQDRRQIERGLEALETIVSGATKGLAADYAGATIGFEMIAPTLVAEAEQQGIIKQQGERILGRLARQRAAKLALLQGRKIDRYVSAAFSAEMAGTDGMHLLDVDNLQEANGSVAYSPAATAYFLLQVQRDERALQYLHSIMDESGAVPYTAPIDVFEQGWVLWSLGLTHILDAELLALCQPHLDFLEKTWSAERGIAAVSSLTLVDGDTSAVVYDVLARFGRNVSVETLFRFEETDRFRCFELEANPSISTNVHMLCALRRGGLDSTHPAAQKALLFLRRTQTDGAYWFDKWHISPYYTTAHAIIGCLEYADELTARSIEWLLATQNVDGTWGYYGIPTAEETAYCLMALACAARNGAKLPREALRHGANWLANHAEPPYPPLWLGKGLYCPEDAVRAAILSALVLCGELLDG